MITLRVSSISTIKEAKNFLKLKSLDSNNELFDIKEIQRDF